MGIAYIAATLLKEDHEVVIYNQDFHHYNEEHLTWYLDNNKFDVVGVGVVGGYYQFRKLLSISSAINKSKNRPFYIIGGHGPSPEPAYFIEKTKADVVVTGEGEVTIVELLKALANRSPLSGVLGIAYHDGSKVVVADRRPVIVDVDTIPMPAYQLFPMEYYRLLRISHCTNSDFVMPVMSGRGCPFHCNFCYQMDSSFRPRSNESIIEEIKFLKKEYGINFISFADDLLMSSKKRAVGLSEDIIKAQLNIKWECNGRLNYVDREVLTIMKRSGCTFINYGIEAYDDRILKNMNKALTTSQIVKGIEETLSIGISPGLNIIFGNIGENHDTLQKGVEFLLKYDDGAQLRTIRPVTPYPGSPLYYHALKTGLLKDVADFYENKHINSDLMTVNFTELSDDEFCESLMQANLKLINNYHEKKIIQMTSVTKDLYMNRNASFRGYRQT